jgi:hypothetical protein
MANEFKHKDPGSTLTQDEFIASDGTGHIFDSQATGDVLYASSTTALARLEAATNGNVLELSSGLPAWTSTPTIGSTSWSNANHAHAASNSGGTLTTLGTVATGVWQGTAIASTYIAADAITGAKIADDAIDSEHYTDGSIDNAHIADDAIDSEHYAAGSIDTAHIANLQITTGLIAADAVTGAKIADDAIDSEHYTDGSIDNAHLADDAVDSDELAAGAIDTAHIADNQVTVAKIEDIARGSIIYGNASAATAELTKGGADEVLTSDGTDIAWAAAGGGGATVREGGNTTEATTTSTSATDLLTAASLTVALIEPFQYMGIARKTTGASAATALGCKINSTTIGAASTSLRAQWGDSGANNRAEDGGFMSMFPARTAAYNQQGNNITACYHSGNDVARQELSAVARSANFPAAEMTDLVMLGISDSASNTLGADELEVYSFTTS